MLFRVLKPRVSHRPVLLGLFVATLWLLPGRAFSQEMQIEAAVQVALQDDAAKTRSQALSDAMTQALEQSVEQAAPELRGRLYLVSARAREFVKSYRVIEDSEQDGRLSLKIAAQVDVARLVRELQAALPKTRRTDGRPKILLCARVTGAETAALGLLTAAADVLQQRDQPTEIGKSENCTDSAVASWPGPRLLFDGSLVTKVAEVRGTSPLLWSALLRGSWQYVTDGSSPPLSEAGEGVGFAEQPDAALAQAVTQLGRPLLLRLAERQGLFGRPGGGVLLMASGLRSPSVMNKLWKALLALPGVARIEPRRFLLSESGDELVHFQLTTTTPAETLGTALYRTPIAGLRVQVTPVGPSTLRLECISAQELPSAEPPGTDAGTP
jgi:hypothetical protein